MRPAYVFFHLRPLLVIVVFPAIILLRTNAPSMSGSTTPAFAGLISAIGLFLLACAHWQVYRPAQWPRERPILFLRAEPSRLVTDGAYRHLRNPQLVGVYLVLMAEAMLFRVHTLLVYGALVCIASGLVAIFVEEAQLERRFGRAYVEYRARTWAFIPGLL